MKKTLLILSFIFVSFVSFGQYTKTPFATTPNPIAKKLAYTNNGLWVDSMVRFVKYKQPGADSLTLGIDTSGFIYVTNIPTRLAQKQNYSDTNTYDATKYWVEKNPINLATSDLLQDTGVDRYYTVIGGSVNFNRNNFDGGKFHVEMDQITTLSINGKTLIQADNLSGTGANVEIKSPITYMNGDSLLDINYRHIKIDTLFNNNGAFVVIDSNKFLNKRSASQVLSDIGAAPILGGSNYIQNQIGTPQPADFNISGTGKANYLDATQIKIDGGKMQLYNNNASNFGLVIQQNNDAAHTGYNTYFNNRSAAGYEGGWVFGNSAINSGVLTIFKDGQVRANYYSGTGIKLAAFDNSGYMQRTTIDPNGVLVTTHNEPANSFLAAPNGTSGNPTFRGIGREDLQPAFGAQTTSGDPDWNGISNTKPGSTVSLLLGNTTNAPSGVGDYYHPFNFEYASKDGTGNLTQFAIPYFAGAGSIYYRSRYNGTFGSWLKLWDSNNLTNVSQLANNAGYITSAALAGYLQLTGGTLTGTLTGTKTVMTTGDNYFNTTSGKTGFGYADGATLNTKFNVNGTAFFEKRTRFADTVTLNGTYNQKGDFLTLSGSNITRRTPQEVRNDIGLANSIISTSSNLTISDTTLTVLVTANVILVMPNPASFTGRIINIRVADGFTATNSGYDIKNFGSNITMTGTPCFDATNCMTGTGYTIQSDGTNWQLIGILD